MPHWNKLIYVKLRSIQTCIVYAFPKVTCHFLNVNFHIMLIDDFKHIIYAIVISFTVVSVEKKKICSLIDLSIHFFLSMK